MTAIALAGWQSDNKRPHHPIGEPDNDVSAERLISGGYALTTEVGRYIIRQVVGRVRMGHHHTMIRCKQQYRHQCTIFREMPQVADSTVCQPNQPLLLPPQLGGGGPYVMGVDRLDVVSGHPVVRYEAHGLQSARSSAAHERHMSIIGAPDRIRASAAVVSSTSASRWTRSASSKEKHRREQPPRPGVKRYVRAKRRLSKPVSASESPYTPLLP